MVIAPQSWQLLDVAIKDGRGKNEEVKNTRGDKKEETK